jgi:hypothetical protein
MKKIHSAVAAGDVFAFVDEAKRDITIKAGLKARKSLQAMLLKGVIDRVGLVDIPFKRLRRPWKIDEIATRLADILNDHVHCRAPSALGRLALP